MLRDGWMSIKGRKYMKTVAEADISDFPYCVTSLNIYYCPLDKLTEIWHQVNGKVNDTATFVYFVSAESL